MIHIEGRKKVPLQLDMAPLIDVVFLLLIFFMLTSTFIQPRVIEIDLPDASSGVHSKTSEVVITLGSDGRRYLNDKQLDSDKLRLKLLGLLNGKADRPVRIQSDASVSVQRLVSTLELVRKAGGVNIDIATQGSKLDSYSINSRGSK